MKLILGRMACLLMVMSGCAMQPYVEPPFQPQLLEVLPNGAKLFSVSSSADKCQPDQILYVDERKNDQQLVVDWSELSNRKRYTVTPVGHTALMDRIRETVRGCAIPVRVESVVRDSTRVDTGERSLGLGLLRYTLQGERIELQAMEFRMQSDTVTGKMTFIPERVDFNRWNDLYVPNLIDQVYNGPVAMPQVAYRIDDHRFFEVVPRNDSPCFRARLYYTDTARGIHANIASWDNVELGEFMIDAANEQYLVAPMIASSPGCQSGGGGICTPRMFYSTDFGRTWNIHKPRDIKTHGEVYLISGVVFYAGRQASLSQLATDGDDAWTHNLINGKWVIPTIQKQPIDKRFSCSSE